MLLGIVGRLDTRVLGAYETAEAIDEGPGADDVALSCACGLFCYGASNHRSTKGDEGLKLLELSKRHTRVCARVLCNAV